MNRKDELSDSMSDIDKRVHENSHEHTVDVSFPDLEASKKAKIVELLKAGSKDHSLIQAIINGKDVDVDSLVDLKSSEPVVEEKKTVSKTSKPKSE